MGKKVNTEKEFAFVWKIRSWRQFGQTGNLTRGEYERKLEAKKV